MKSGEKASRMQSPRTTVEMDAVSLLEELTRTTRSRSARLQCSVGTAMAAEVLGVCVLTGILGLVFNKSLGVHSINWCIDTLLKNQ